MALLQVYASRSQKEQPDGVILVFDWHELLAMSSVATDVIDSLVGSNTAYLDDSVICPSDDPGTLLIKQHTEHREPMPPERGMVAEPPCYCAQRQPAAAPVDQTRLLKQQLLR
jgi:hypothetical protein